MLCNQAVNLKWAVMGSVVPTHCFTDYFNEERTYAENSDSQSSAQPSPPSEDTEEEQSNGATTRTATSTSYQDGLVICVDIMFIFSNCIVYNNFTL